MTSLMGAPPEVSPEPSPGPSRSVPVWLGRTARVAGFVIALMLAAVSAAYEAFLTPLYWGTTRLPVSLVAAVVCNLALVWFAYAVTGRRLAAVGPALVWVAVMVTAASRTAEGDLVLTDNNWVGIGTMLAGSVAFAVAGYRLMLTGIRPRPVPPVRAEESAEPDGHPSVQDRQQSSGTSGARGHPRGKEQE
jgi:hypothetical protein